METMLAMKMFNDSFPDGTAMFLLDLFGCRGRSTVASHHSGGRGSCRASVRSFCPILAAGASRDDRVYQGNRNAASARGSVIRLSHLKCIGVNSAESVHSLKL